MTIKDSFLKALPSFFVIVGFVIAFMMIQQSIGVSSQNNFYNRFQACVLSVKPITRDDNTIKGCYDRVERETGVKAPRYQTQGY